MGVWDELDLIDSVKELNNHHGSMMYILLYCNNMVCTTKIVDINKFLSSENVLEEHLSDNEGVMLLHALVLNQQELPGDIPAELKDKYELACIRITLAGIIEFEEQTDMDSVIEFIESEVDNPHVDIDDFAVIVYKKVPFILQVATPPTEITTTHKKEMGVWKNA